VRLDIGVVGAEQVPSERGRAALDLIDALAAGIEPVADGALGVLVGEPVPHRQQYGELGVVLAGDELQLAALVVELVHGRRGDVGNDLTDHVERGSERHLTSVDLGDRGLGYTFRSQVRRQAGVRGNHGRSFLRPILPPLD
jgi:hypothetical protein